MTFTPAHATPPAIGYRPDIDGLRAVAVLAVLVHHAFPEYLPGGFIGVDVFFVISGYLISSIILGELQQGRYSFASFYSRRIRRIFPALLLVLGSTALIGWHRLTADEYALLGKHLLAGAAFASNFVLWQEAGYFDAESVGKPLLHLWSLAIEEQFYLFWPLMLFAVYRWRPGAVVRMTILLILASFTLNLALVGEYPVAAFYNTAARIWELLAGALLAFWHLRLAAAPHLRKQDHPDKGAAEGTEAAAAHAPSPGRLPGNAAFPGMQLLALVPRGFLGSNTMAAGGLALIVLALVLLHPERLFPGAWAVLPTLGATLLIAAGPQAWINRRLLSSRPMVWIGLISYPLYLWHWPLLSVAHLQSAGEPAWTLRLGLALLSVLLAALTYVCIERPLRHGRVNTRWLVSGLSVAMAGVALAGAIVLKFEGFEQRFPPEIRALTTGGGTRMVTQGWRHNDCMLDFRQPARNFKDFCIEERRPLVFLWGDSHAGSLYPGFKAVQDSGLYDFGIGERSGSICPPILGIEPRPLCRSLNENAIRAIRQSRPDIVVLYAWWHHPRYDLTPLESTVAELRAAGVPRIVLLGATPYWQGPLPRVLFDAWRRGPVSRLPPLRLKDELDPQLEAITQAMSARAQAMGIEFISGMDAFCNEQGCLTRLSEGADEPLSYDYGHLAPAAVTHYVQWLAPQILEPFRVQPRQ